MRSKFNSTRVIALFVVLCAFTTANAQAIFAHNDYVKPNPFFKAYELKAEYIESDVFLENGKLLVAHTKSEMDPSKTLESMYLDPLSEKVKSTPHNMTLMIDLKTEGKSTLAAIVAALEKYPILTKQPGLYITISGNYPPPSEWTNYPDFITFDGRPNTVYTEAQLKKTRLISTSFSSVSKWNGQGEIPASDLEKIKQTTDAAHKLGKPMRFWAQPDSENAWQKFIDLGIDIINSDKVEEVSKFLATRK
jgi:alkaline phosphatase